MEIKKIGFIGFGEVGQSFASEMKVNGADILYYDILPHKMEFGTAALSLPDLIDRCDILLSTTSTHVAINIAQDATRYLTAGKIFADMNSTSGSIKAKIAEIIEASQADFIEGAILSAVGEAGPKSAILVCGKKGEEFSSLMNRLGLINLKYLSPKIGEASLVKMVRSVFSKGIECLLLEMLIAGRRAGVAEYVWQDVVDYMTNRSFDRVAINWIRTHSTAFERRYHEMTQVVETLEELGVEPLMSQGTKAFFLRSKTLGMEKAFERKPEIFWEVVSYMEKNM